ncbi:MULTISPECIES: XVIPCD domain-containing protein [unclassified Stenotrophomonas]|uniref:XVIPCD domain-containing protein n=1 Tax=unclassified Stenotrophomonas TaxID=196198 RepID=UPI002119069C|nr:MULTISPECIES: XVIPCD domain-containing protein [unclassified Stenotrophomonas]
MDEKIEIGYRNIGSVLGKEYHHKFILYTDRNGEQHTISGWTGDAQVGLPYGRIQVEANLAYDAANPDHPKNPNATGQAQYRERIASGADLSGTWAQMVANAQGKDDKYPYDPQRQNSNTFADSVLRDAHLREPTQDGVGGHWAPASGRPLDHSLKPVVPGLGTSGNTFSANDAAADPGREVQLRANPLYRQALAGLEQLGPEVGVYADVQDKERIAAALALRARTHVPPIPEIHEVVPSATNGNVFAVWKSADNDQFVMRAHVDRGEATQQPLMQNLQALETADAQQVRAQAQEQSQNQNEVGRATMRMG